MKSINFAKKIMGLLILFYLIYNTIFGWNMLPINEVEKKCDFIYSLGIYLAFIIYFLPVLRVYENFIKKHESNSRITFSKEDMEASFDAGVDRGFDEGQDQSRSNHSEPRFNEWFEEFIENRTE